MSNNLGVNYGFIYENVIAQELKTHGFELFYFRNKRIGEVDFVNAQEDGITLKIRRSFPS